MIRCSVPGCRRKRPSAVWPTLSLIRIHLCRASTDALQALERDLHAPAKRRGHPGIPWDRATARGWPKRIVCRPGGCVVRERWGGPAGRVRRRSGNSSPTVTGPQDLLTFSCVKATDSDGSASSFATC
jgi:hypothetical protein